MTIGTSVTSEFSSVTGYYKESLYLNSQTGILWKCTGTNWMQLGDFKGAKGDDGTDGIDGVSLTASSSKSGKTTTVQIKNAATGSVVNQFDIQDGTDGSGSGDMSKAEYADSEYGIVKKATALSDGSGSFAVATSNVSDGQALVYDNATGKWKNGNAQGTVDQSYNATSANAQSGIAVSEAVGSKISNPSTKANGQVLTYNGSEWTAATPASGHEMLKTKNEIRQISDSNDEHVASAYAIKTYVSSYSSQATINTVTLASGTNTIEIAKSYMGKTIELFYDASTGVKMPRIVSITESTVDDVSKTTIVFEENATEDISIQIRWFSTVSGVSI